MFFLNHSGNGGERNPLLVRCITQQFAARYFLSSVFMWPLITVTCSKRVLNKPQLGEKHPLSEVSVLPYVLTKPRKPGPSVGSERDQVLRVFFTQPVLGSLSSFAHDFKKLIRSFNFSVNLLILVSQVKITSSGLLSVVYITERYKCQYPETILSIIKCMIHNFWTPEESNDITIIIHPYGETVCFSVKPARKTFIYTISVKQNSKSVFITLDFLGSAFLE